MVAGDRTNHAEKVAAIVLAAGKSTRARRLKPLMEWEGETFLQRTVASLRAAEIFQEVLVVTGFGADALEEGLMAHGTAFVFNKTFDLGMHSSIRCGLNHLTPGWTAALIALVDQPHLRPEAYRTLVTAYLRSGKPLGRPVFGGMPGTPAIIAAQFLDEVNAEPDRDQGCAYLFHRHAHQVAEISMLDDGCLLDFDTPESLEAYNGRHLP